MQQQKSPGTESEPGVPGCLPSPPRFRFTSLPLVLRWRIGFQVRQRIGHFRCQLSLRIEYEHDCAFRRNGVEIFPSDACWNIDLGVARSPHRVAIHTQRKRVAVALVLIEYHDRQLCSMITGCGHGKHSDRGLTRNGRQIAGVPTAQQIFGHQLHVVIAGTWSDRGRWSSSAQEAEIACGAFSSALVHTPAIHVVDALPCRSGRAHARSIKRGKKLTIQEAANPIARRVVRREIVESNVKFRKSPGQRVNACPVVEGIRGVDFAGQLLKRLREVICLYIDHIG